MVKYFVKWLSLIRFAAVTFALKVWPAVVTEDGDLVSTPLVPVNLSKDC